MMRLTKLRTMSLGSGPGSFTAILSTAVLSTLGSPVYDGMIVKVVYNGFHSNV